MPTISTSLTGVGSTSVLEVPREGETVSVALSGTYNMTVRLERATSPAELAWETIKEWNTANDTVAFDHVTRRKKERFRLTVTVDTSGTVVTSLSDSDRVHKIVTDGEGNALQTIKQSGMFVNKKVQSDFEVGTPGTGVSAKEYSADGINFTTVLTLTDIALTIGDNASLAIGALIYTMPAGDIAIKAVAASVGLTLTTGTPTTDTPEFGLGSVIGSGANATLGAVGATSEDILGPVVMNNIAGTAEVIAQQLAMTMLSAGVHTVNANFADAWANVDNTDSTLSGIVTISWSKLPLS